MNRIASKDDNIIDTLYNQFLPADGQKRTIGQAFGDMLLGNTGERFGREDGGGDILDIIGGLVDLYEGEYTYSELEADVIFPLLDGLKSGKLKIYEDDLKKLLNDVNDYSNERVALGSFSNTPFEIYDTYSDSQREKLFNEGGTNVLKIFLNKGHFWKINPDNILYAEDLYFEDQDAKFVEPFTDHVMKMSESDSLDNATSKIIAEITRDNYSFNQFKRDVAKQINDTITDPSIYEGAFIQLGFPKEHIDFYIGLTLGDDGFYSLSEHLYSGDPTVVPQDGLSTEEVQSFQHPNVLQFPTTIIKDQDGNIIEEVKDELLAFKDLIDSDITDYKFRFQQDLSFSENYLGGDITNDRNTSSVTKWLREAIATRLTVSEQIRAWVVVSYVGFLTSLVEDVQENNLSDSIGEHYATALKSNLLDLVLQYVLFEKIISAKKAFFDSLAQATAEDSDEGDDITPAEREKAYRETVKNFKTGQGESIPKDPPSEEELENRQRFFKQCALMLNMPSLRDTYQEKLNEQYSGLVPYHGRFTTLRSVSGNQESMLSSLVSSAQEQKLFELEGHKVSRLVPKIRLFKVFTVGGKEKEIEFIFDRTSQIDRPEGPQYTSATKFMDIDFDKGSGVGLKSFSFEFNGTNPAEARNDITASLSLFFQSFSDFTRFRKGRGEKDEYRFVDLVIQPTPDDQGKVNGIDVQSDRQYEPQFYRIRAEVGYVVPTDIDETGINGFTSAERDAIRISNKSFFLNMVDHDISFGKDGSVEIKISYRAYLESLLKHPRLDALASPELINKRIQNAKTLTTQLNNKQCSVEQIKELQISLAAQERILIKQSLSSIITRLKNRKVIYNVNIKKEDKQDFMNLGYFPKCDLETGVEDGSEGVDVKLVLNSDLPESSDDFDFMDSANRSIQFFYFGDLLYTILDCVYSSEGKYRTGTGFERNSIILGSFEFEPFQSVGIVDSVYNIADIPISVDFFSRWFVDNVVSQKSTRKTFPVMNFIRSLSNHLIKPSLIENCVNRKLETRLRFQTTQVTADSKGGANPLEGAYAFWPDGRKPVSMDVSDLRSIGILPFRGGPINDANSSYKDFHTFIVLSAIGSTLSYSGIGSYKEDINNGRFHVHIGQNAGLVKTLSLSKSDQQYIREARFFQNGIDGLLQLSAVYVANIEMFGNTLFYPGMEIFFNPYGIGGPTFDPRKGGSIANKLGIGGYHTITSVKSSISPGKFTTSISAQQYYSGDGSGNPNVVKKRSALKKATAIEEYVPEDPNSESDYQKCKNVILDTQRFKYATEVVTPTIEDPVEEVMGDTAVIEPTSTEPIDTPTAEEAFGDPEIVNVSRTTEIIDGKPVDVVYTQYKDGTVMITKTIDGVEETSFA